MHRRSAFARWGAVIALILLTACNQADDPAIDASGTGTTSTSTTSSSSVPDAAAPPVSVPATRERAYLTAVRADTKDDGGSRVVFEFDPVLPGYKVDYIERPVTMDGSGDEVKVAGEAVLEIIMENAAQARFEGEKVIETYTGPPRLQPAGAGAVVEVVEAGDFEGLVHWVVGLRQKNAKISVSTLSGPSRLVLDITPA
ncbi:MAG TPA: hypothetical protein VM142_08080 [Acidimicrobiales bacterium]|nr:hypothetical protein [Acidimicrobiales bacterium]